MPRTHALRVHPSADRLPRSAQLAWAIAEVATDPVAVPDEVTEMIVNRVIDNAAVAAASLTRAPVATARAQALAHPYAGSTRRGATVSGLPPATRVTPEWAAWANGVAVRELDFHDTFLAADYSHPGDNIPPLLAVAQHRGLLRRGSGARHRRRRTRCRSTSSARSLARAQDRPRRPPRSVGRGRDRHDAAAVAEVCVPGDRAGAAHHDRDPAVPQGRDLQLEGVRPGVRRQGRDRGGRPGDARRDVAQSPIYEGTDGVIAQLLDGPAAALRRAAAGAGRAQAGDPRLVHEGALGGVPERRR